MRNYSILFLILTVVTALIGFTGLDFYGIEAVRILSLVFADLFVISILAKIILPKKEQVRLDR